MQYSRLLPRTRQGTTGLAVDADLNMDECYFLLLPERIASFSVAVHKSLESANIRYTIETSCSPFDKVGDTGQGGYWDNVFGKNVELTEETVSPIINCVTAVRVKVLECTSGVMNVAICG